MRYEGQTSEEGLERYWENYSQKLAGRSHLQLSQETPNLRILANYSSGSI